MHNIFEGKTRSSSFASGVWAEIQDKNLQVSLMDLCDEGKHIFDKVTSLHIPCEYENSLANWKEFV